MAIKPQRGMTMRLVRSKARLSSNCAGRNGKHPEGAPVLASHHLAPWGLRTISLIPVPSAPTRLPVCFSHECFYAWAPVNLIEIIQWRRQMVIADSHSLLSCCLTPIPRQVASTFNEIQPFEFFTESIWGLSFGLFGPPGSLSEGSSSRARHAWQSCWPRKKMRAHWQPGFDHHFSPNKSSRGGWQFSNCFN